MNSVYIVFEIESDEYIPKPMDIFEPKIENSEFVPSFGGISSNPLEIPHDPFTSTQFPKPRFNPLIPSFTREPKEIKGKNDKIVCVCKDLETAKHYLNSSNNRYIIGPFKIM
jgi:hypothetical protein